MTQENLKNNLRQAPPEYLGGLLDAGLFFRAEGRNVKSRRPGVPPVHRVYPQVAIFDTREHIIREIRGLFGGNIYGVNGKNQTRRVWEWNINDAEVLQEFLSEHERQLRLKQPLAQVFLDFFHSDASNDTPEVTDNLRTTTIQSYRRPCLPSPIRLAGMLDLAGGMGVYQRQTEQGVLRNELGFSLTTPFIGLIQALRDHYPTTSYYISRKTTRRYHGCPTYIWWATGEDAAQVTEDIAPHMIFRRPLVQAMRRGLNEGIAVLEPELPSILPLMKGLKKRT